MFIPHVLNCGCPLIDFIMQDNIPSYIPIYAYNIGFTGQFKALSATAIQKKTIPMLREACPKTKFHDSLG